jgi:hypothetical protein
MVELIIKVEDASYSLKVVDVAFNNEAIPLEAANMFKPRAEKKYKLAPGRYMLVWRTEKGTGRWSDEPIINHERILVLESGDSVVRVNIKGDGVTLY